MADDVPVTDILCEAMEYLCKLGSNLRSRSENLKEKRIRKDRLNNSHAVHKAARKVLTICELSKKSLENVESGVKRVLSVVDAAQASTGDGGKTEKRDISSPHSSAHKSSSENRIKHKKLSSPQSIYVSGKKFKLRFPINVNVKHFQSVKVMAKSMPMSMWEKYPVYYNCKLYRARERKILKETKERKLSSGSESKCEESKETKQKDSEPLAVEDSKIEIQDEDACDGKLTAETEDVKLEESEGKNKHKRKESSDFDSSKKSDEEEIQKDLVLKKNADESKEKACLKHKSDDSSKKSHKEKKHSDQKKDADNNDKKDKHKKTKHKRIIVDSSSESDQDKSKRLPGNTTDNESNKVALHDEEKELDTRVENLNKISENVPDEIINQLSESSNERSDGESTEQKTKDSTLKNPDERLSEEKPNQESGSEETSKEKSDDEPLIQNIAEKEDSNSEQKKDEEADEDDQKTEPVRPIIKCVSLTKLLKPQVLEEKEGKSQVHKNRKGELKSILRDPVKAISKNSKSTDNGNIKSLKFKPNFDKTITILSEDEEDVEEKKKQVAAFKAKTFDITVMKLPKISVNFLHENSLKKITRNGTIICEIITDTRNSDSDSRPVSSMDDKSTNEAKNALLNDSDGEKSEESSQIEQANAPTLESINESDRIKKSLQNDSESDKNEEQPNETTSKSVSKTSDDRPSKTLEAESEPNKNSDDLHITTGDNRESPHDKEHALNNDDQDKEIAKSSLLNDSSGSSTKSPQKKRKKDNSGTKSRRKHIMESMHAKKMLLTYSSSSDTEDEQLKNVIKDIKDNLIKDIESESEVQKPLTKNVFSTSESDDDGLKHVNLKHVKKKRKISKSRSPSQDGQAKGASDAEDSTKKEVSSASDAEDSNKEGNSANCGHSASADEKSNSSRSKMGRSREKAGGSSSQNSDTLEDRDIEGLTNLKSLNNHRRRRDSDSDKAGSTTSAQGSTASIKKKMANKHIAGEEGLLEAPESSDEASAAESEGVEDLPPISLPGLNGDGLDHLAKDDLLEESDSNSSKDKGSDGKKDTDSESDALKSKRRKGNTISSDSEAGSSRRKDKDVRVSDFEDSEDENSEIIKRSKRKKKGSESDASDDSSGEGGKKKRRRIKELDSDASGSDSENEGKNKHGRKNIRKVMGKNQLEEATKKAAREEKERVARIVERQKMYNNLEFDETGKPDEVIVDKVVLDFDPSTKEPLIEVDRGLVKKLKPHQANGIKFMWDACFESVKRIKKDRGSGCILAHCMGLGKTLQVVSLTHTLLTHSDLTKVNRVLVVCPLSTVLNWVNEFKMWLKHAETDYEVDVYELSKFKQNSERAFQLSSWFTHGGVCVLGYEMFRNLSADNPKKYKKKMLRQFQESLVDPGPDLVVCDEGHLLKNEKTSLSQSMNRVKTLRRIVLTGTPLQNNLKEYYCMVQFVKPNLLGKYNEYLNRFVNPITNGQYTDSTEYDIKVMKRRSHVLHKMLDGAVQRRDYGVLAPFLPPKHEYVLFITLTDVQAKLYQHYLDNYSRRPLPGKSSGFLFPDFQSLQRIWTHPLVLKYNSERYEIMQQKKREREEEEDSEGSLADFIDDDSTPDETSSDEESDSLSDVSDDSRKKSKKKKSAKKSKKEGKSGQRRGTRANPVELEDVEQEPEVLEVKNENPTEWWIPLVTDDEVEDMRNSHKLVLLFEILRQCEAIGDKLLVFSQSLYSLDLIEHFLGKVDEATQEGRIDEKLGGHVGSWSPGIDYFRLDGSTSCENRSIWCKNFNREDNPRARLFLISTRAGGLGINLVAANRVVIFDVSWNPSHDVQSIFRVYRFGQKKPCYVYRFLAMGTMEEKIYERQVTKQAISKRVIDEQQIDRHYAENDLAELYKFEPRPPEPRPVPLVPKDRLFAEMLKEREAAIYKFHEHDSLLENKEEETLSEEERKAAWEDFENEKNRPPPQPFPSWPMHNGMGQLPNLLAQQQQQLAYAALAQMLRKDMPNLSDDNIRAMLPLIYSSNPQMFGGYDYGLMQKISSMYAQPGMMNPAMMNPAMNVGGAASGLGGGGTSGLQYEPPWQRQQQQQQQMRLQQLMQQQQNQMGAKFYAGGLGSRDPIAMALQQQRAREIMLGGGGGVAAAGAGGGGGAGAGRPRGRPPLQPRAPAPAPGDVVNLDSD